MKFRYDSNQNLDNKKEKKDDWKNLHLWEQDTTLPLSYFTFFIHLSQYFSITVAISSTLNKASCVSSLPHKRSIILSIGNINNLYCMRVVFIVVDKENKILKHSELLQSRRPSTWAKHADCYFPSFHWWTSWA